MIKANINNQIFEIAFSDNHLQEGTINNKPFCIDSSKVNNNTWHIIKDNQSYNIEILKTDRENKSIELKVNGKVSVVKISDKYDELLKNLGLENSSSKKVLELKAPMPGLVISISAKDGDTIAKGDTLLVLEAMKMENIIKSPTDGVIKKIHISKATAVEKNQLLISFL